MSRSNSGRSERVGSGHCFFHAGMFPWCWFRHSEIEKRHSSSVLTWKYVSTVKDRSHDHEMRGGTLSSRRGGHEFSPSSRCVVGPAKELTVGRPDVPHDGPGRSQPRQEGEDQDEERPHRRLLRLCGPATAVQRENFFLPAGKWVRGFPRGFEIVYRGALPNRRNTSSTRAHKLEVQAVKSEQRPRDRRGGKHPF